MPGTRSKPASRKSGAAKPNTLPAEAHIGFVAGDMLRLLRADFVERTRRIPLTPALHRLLIHVDRKPGCRQVELAEWLGVTPVTVSRMLDRLEKQSLVRRASLPGDKRVSRIYVGPAAGKLLSLLNAEAGRTLERAFRGMSEQERAGLLAALARVRDNLAPPGHERPADAPSPATETRRGR